MKYPKALGPYSVCRWAGETLFLSGQLPVDPDTNNFANGDIKDKTRQCFKNMSEVLKEQGLTLNNVVKVNVFLKDMNDFAAVNEAYAEFFNTPYPARSAVEVARLPKDSPIEIEAVAYKN